ncbi:MULTISPECIES: DoxX family membrane protein [unclassified Streptomyces]|uniref:DoxX family membrane protein n=1 Tax=Streptomyces TaxID=1883 RepID=UPI00136968DF|nr:MULTISPECIES: DoxX family membrane protein [unclassified Streptomyces]NEA03344.1 DoxX family membrane protein [Streptomyces sp. SID10116]MYY80154.1 DoxX family membrane protein [Streptomyces sp. SID335]MYZ14436.1 DoxX family membrane protein [Streptomyces sp. SID337]NDZ85370.1 DoxX family membrane protein [Streptomyces sp. SID10115]NEB46521.1 DoxX family membrane protein [Streptomyces sp. SID339]
MAVDQHTNNKGFHLPSFRRNHSAPVPGSAAVARTDTHAARAYVFASARVLMGFVFLWAFLDKTFGFGYATRSGEGWVDGGSPTEGFLGRVAVGPMESTFHSWAGAAWADWLFMLGLLGIGLALTAGVALRLTALAGTVMMALMWVAEWPPAQHLSDGSPSMSTNPFADYHLVYAVLLVALAAASAGDTLGLGRRWAGLPIVRDHGWLR